MGCWCVLFPEVFHYYFVQPVYISYALLDEKNVQPVCHPLRILLMNRYEVNSVLLLSTVVII